MSAKIESIARPANRLHDNDPALLLRLSQAKRAYTARHFTGLDTAQLLTDPALVPQPGDLLLARVTRLGKHVQLEQASGRKASLFVGDEIVVTYAARYAPDQFEAHVPADLSPCHLVAGGGVAASVMNKHLSVTMATEITPLGLLADALGQRLNLRQRALAMPKATGRRPAVIASVGTSMNAGKTTSAAHLIRGLVRAGYKVGAAKVTGTGSGNDPWLLRDAGAHAVLDFTDAGYASTHLLDLAALQGVMQLLMANLAAQQVDVIVLEVADGLLQGETALLLQSLEFSHAVDGLVFSSGDAMGAAGGASCLRQHGLRVLALCGVLTKSPLARREAQHATGLPVLGLEELGDPVTAHGLLHSAMAGKAAAAA